MIDPDAVTQCRSYYIWVGALYLSKFMSSLLFDIQPTDPLVYVSVSVLLLLVALLASYLPARRAALKDPIIALRSE